MVNVILDIIATTLRLATPLIFAALGGVISEKSGVVNIGIEGMLVTGAFFAVAGTLATDSLIVGVMCGMAAGAAIAALHAVLSIKFKADQVISGVAINILAGALSSYLIFQFYDIHSQTAGIEPMSYPREMFEKIPVIGRVLGQLNWYVYGAIILVILVHFVFKKTALGLRIRAVGEHPKAADTMGVNVIRLRYICVLLSGVFAGLGGASLAMNNMLFREGMVSGRGFIALAAVIFGNWNPVGAFLACLLFGFADALKIQAPALGWSLPTEVYFAMPYVLTMLALAGFVGKTTAPAADGVPYEKGSR
ncbi:ABC transporter permease [Clostridium cellulovorans]|uniref:Inner-membrane translocator n=1 Tax=Clostridium cellulovorans (strain ATCC 35296 / DSM 3052 / OCM 3 / 743B) TaxID=573061 RepID=D9SRW8_CLOC7|nr:ABC transporter permease [Clostridium cellulovorans]ADL50485.1 inner-membrane translocator [Clostridium cellulovorans 743B]